MRSELRERTVECEELQECNENLLSEADKAYHLPAGSMCNAMVTKSGRPR